MSQHQRLEKSLPFSANIVYLSNGRIYLVTKVKSSQYILWIHHFRLQVLHHFFQLYIIDIILVKVIHVLFDFVHFGPFGIERGHLIVIGDMHIYVTRINQEFHRLDCTGIMQGGVTIMVYGILISTLWTTRRRRRGGRCRSVIGVVIMILYFRPYILQYWHMAVGCRGL